MNLVTCKFPWQNMAAAYATVTRSTLGEIFEFCGHTGNEIGWPQLPEPFRRVGFHTQEMVDFSLTKGYSVTAISKQYYTIREGSTMVSTYPEDALEKRFHNYMRNYYGVMAFDFGVCVWDGQKLLIPQTGQIIDYTDQSAEVFFMLMKVK